MLDSVLLRPYTVDDLSCHYWQGRKLHCMCHLMTLQAQELAYPPVMAHEITCKLQVASQASAVEAGTGKLQKSKTITVYTGHYSTMFSHQLDV